MKNVQVYNNYYSAPYNIYTIAHFDPRPTRRACWSHRDDLTSHPINQPNIHSEYLNFNCKKNTQIVVAQFISKYATSADSSICNIINNLRLLDLMFMDMYTDIDNHMDEINFDPNEALRTYMDTRLYIRTIKYDSRAITLFKFRVEESFLIGMKPLYRTIAITSLARAKCVHQFTMMCLKQK